MNANGGIGGDDLRAIVTQFNTYQHYIELGQTPVPVGTIAG
jgi:hypothetical protein